VVGDLEEVEWRHAPADEVGIDLLLDVTGQEEPPAGDLAKEDDRHVVDPSPVVRGLLWNRSGVGPQDPQIDVVDPEAITGHQAFALATGLHEGAPGPVPGTRPAHPGFVEPPHAVAAQQQRQTGNMVLVRMAEHDDVEAPVPGRDLLVEGTQQALRIRATVDEQPAAAVALDEDRIALADVEDHDAGDAVRPLRNGQAGPEHGHDRDDRAEPGDPSSAGRRPLPRGTTRSAGERRDPGRRHVHGGLTMR